MEAISSIMVALVLLMIFVWAFWPRPKKAATQQPSNPRIEPATTVFDSRGKTYDPNLVLVVDDDKDIVEAIARAIEAGIPGVKIVTACDGNQALTVFETAECLPGVVVLDMMLPKRSGFLVMERIKKPPDPQEAPAVIMITGNQGLRHETYAKSLGCWSYLRKPFGMGKLVEQIRRVQKLLTKTPAS